MTQERIQSDDSHKKAEAVEYDDKEVTSNYKAQLEERGEKNRISHGVNTGYFALEGRTVGKVKKMFGDAYNIPKDAVAYVGDQKVDDEFVLMAGQEIDFQKETGTKGAMADWREDGF